MAELRYYVAPMAIGPVFGGTELLRTHPWWRSRLNPAGTLPAQIAMMPLGKRDIGILAVSAEPAEHDAFVAAGAGVELPHKRNMRLADMSRLRDVVPLALIDSRIGQGTPGWQAIRYLGRTAQFLQRINGQFGSLDVVDADRTRFAELGERYAALKDEPDFRTRLEAAVDAWPELLPLRCGAGVDLGFDPLVQGGALPMSDAFTNTNGTALSSHNALWVTPFGNEPTIQSNTARIANDSQTRLTYWNETWGNDQYMGATAATTGNFTVGPAVRVQTSSVNGMLWQTDWGSGIYLTEYVSAAGTDIITYSAVISAGTVLEIRVTGTGYEGFSGGPLVSRGTATNSTYSSGRGGIGGYNTGASTPACDNAYGDNLGAAAAGSAALRRPNRAFRMWNRRG